jgi:prepilin-type processing-associated H-X9-DG protein
VRMPATPADAHADEQIVGVAKPAAPQPYNLAFLPADTKMIVGIQPQTVLEHAELRRLLEPIKQAPGFRGMPITPEDIEQIVVFWDAVSEPASAPNRNSIWPFASGGVLRTSKAQDWPAIVKSARLGSIREARHDGQVFFEFQGPWTVNWGAFAPDDQTLVIAREDLLRELIEDRNTPAHAHSWDEAWNKTKKGSVMLAVETRWLRRHLTQALRGGVKPAEADSAEARLETISPLLDKAQAYTLAIETSPGVAIDLVAVATSDANSKSIADTAQALLTLATNAASGIQRNVRGSDDTRAASDWLFSTATSLLSDARIETSGRLVHLQTKSPVNLGAGFKHLEPAIVAARSAARRAQSVNNLKQICLAFHNYHSTNNRFPTAVMYGGQSGKVPYSWRVAILPYLEQNELYKLYNFDEPWDGPNNRKLLDKMPAVLGYPGVDGGTTSATNTAYFVFTGKGTALSPLPNPALVGEPAATKGNGAKPVPVRSDAAGPTLAQFFDGTSNTILAVEAKRDIPWTKPEDLPVDPNAVLPGLGGYSANGFNAAYADGSVRFLPNSVNATVLKALITRDGGEVIRFDELSEPTTPTATR